MPFVDPDRIEQSDRVQAASFAPHVMATVMVSSGITKNGLSKNKVDPCGVCSLGLKANSVLYVQCGKWIHS